MNFGSSGATSLTRLAMELFKIEAGKRLHDAVMISLKKPDVVHVHYFCTNAIAFINREICATSFRRYAPNASPGW
jgi:hypothetical protein